MIKRNESDVVNVVFEILAKIVLHLKKHLIKQIIKKPTTDKSTSLFLFCSSIPKDAMDASRPEEIMESTVDPNEWKLEVERVTPSLKVHIRTDNKDWRTHVDQMHTHRDGINTAMSEAKVAR